MLWLEQTSMDILVKGTEVMGTFGIKKGTWKDGWWWILQKQWKWLC